MIVGTLQYMAPEQLEGREADARTDVFALGTLLYEMVTGRRAFDGANATSLIAAILRDEPPAMSSLQRVSPVALDVVVHACLAKDPDARIQTIYDVGLQLRWIRDGAFSGTAVVAAPVPRRGGLWRAVAVAVIAAAVGGLAVAAIAQRNRPGATEPSFRQLTFRRGFIDSARFTPDGQTILYSAVWDGKPRQIFSLRVDSGESQPLPLPPGLVLSISRRGELALLIKTSGRSLVGTLASVPLGGGGLREVLDNVSAAEWSPDGKELAVLRRVGTETLLEYPIGTELRRWTDGDPCCFRISPDGALLAVMEQNPVGSGRGFLSLIDRTGRSVKTSRAFGAVTGGITWTPSGDEAWFNASEVGLNYSVYALSRTGQERLVRSNAESLQVSDRAADGRAIVTSDRIRGGIVGLAPGETQPRDLSWMDFGRPTAVSRDGRLLAFTESGAGVGPIATAFVRGTDGSPAIRIAEGAAMGLSPDGRSILLITRDRRQIRILPIGAGSPRVLEIGNLQVVSGFATWTPDGKRVIFSASEPGRPRRLFSSPVNGGGPVPVTPEQIRSGEGPPLVSPDSRFLVALDAAAKVWRYPLDGGAPAPLSGFLPGDLPLQWSPDGRAIWVLARERPPARIERVDLATGARSPWREIADADPSGLDHTWFRLLLSADGTSSRLRLRPHAVGFVSRGRSEMTLRQTAAATCAAWLATLGAVSAQTAQATVRGKVVDAAGERPAGCRHHDAGLRNRFDAVGHHDECRRVPSAEPSCRHVQLQAQLTGFRSARIGPFVLGVGHDRTIDLSLEIGSVAQEISVAGVGGLLKTTQHTLGSTIDSSLIDDLPTVGRDFSDLARLAAGVTTGVGGNGDTLSFNGQRGYANGVFVDGASNEWNYYGSQATSFPQDWIREFQVMTNSFPVPGTASGGLLNVITRSGTNTFTGRAYGFCQDDRLERHRSR